MYLQTDFSIVRLSKKLNRLDKNTEEVDNTNLFFLK